MFGGERQTTFRLPNDLTTNAHKQFDVGLIRNWGA